jgi:hypothetical protein
LGAGFSANRIQWARNLMGRRRILSASCRCKASKQLYLACALLNCRRQVLGLVIKLPDFHVGLL